MNSCGMNRLGFFRTLFGGVLAGISIASGLKSKRRVTTRPGWKWYSAGFKTATKPMHPEFKIAIFHVRETDFAGQWKWVNHDLGCRHDWTPEEKSERERLGL